MAIRLKMKRSVWIGMHRAKIKNGVGNVLQGFEGHGSKIFRGLRPRTLALFSLIGPPLTTTLNLRLIVATSKFEFLDHLTVLKNFQY